MWLISVTRPMCAFGAGVFKFVVQLSHSPILVTESSNMALHGKELSEDLKRRIVALHEDGQGYKKIVKTLKLSCSTVAKIIQCFKRAWSTQNRSRVGRPVATCEALVNSMPRRVKAVLDNDGGHSKYWQLIWCMLILTTFPKGCTHFCWQGFSF